MDEKMVRITNIQRFSLHDGPGIRTTVFLKGCNLHCPWCTNPENLSYKMQKYYEKEKCICQSDECVICKDCTVLNANSNILLNEIPYQCPAVGIYGKDIDLAELETAVLKDNLFYGTDGGVTFSGGEPLLQLQVYKELLKKLRRNGVHVAVETALFVNKEIVEQAVEVFDLIIADIKILSKQFCKDTLGGDLELYLSNMKYVSEHAKEVWLRFPAIPNYTLTEQNIKQICVLLSSLNYSRFQILKGHNLAEKKYRTLEKEILMIKDVNLEYMLEICNQNNIGYEVLNV